MFSAISFRGLMKTLVNGKLLRIPFARLMIRQLQLFQQQQKQKLLNNDPYHYQIRPQQLRQLHQHRRHQQLRQRHRHQQQLRQHRKQRQQQLRHQKWQQHQ